MAAVTALRRPDTRMFVSFVGSEPAAYGPLTEAAARSLGRPVSTMVDEDDVPKVAALRDAGFEPENVSERFRIGFGDVLPRLTRAWVPSGFSIHPADEVDEDRLFALDNAVRHDVPGTDGWQGDRRWFHEELAEAPPFDPAAYLVAVDDQTDRYVGLVRVWRNPDGPRFGLIGVLREYRRTPIAAALLKHALSAASGWGHATFTTETSLTNAVIYPRLQQLAAESMGRFLQLVLR